MKWLTGLFQVRQYVPTEEEFHQLLNRQQNSADTVQEQGISLGVKLAVTEPQQLRERIEEALEQRKEPAEPDYQAHGGQLHEALQEQGDVEGAEHGKTVVQHRRGVLDAQEPHRERQRNRLAHTLEEELPAEAWGTRVHRLVDQRGRPPEVAEVGEVDVIRVRA